MTPRSDPHTEAIRVALDYGFSKGHPIRDAGDAALAALGEELMDAEHALADMTYSRQLQFDAANLNRDRAVAAEARVTQLAGERRDADAAIARFLDERDDQFLMDARSALGVVADGGGGRDGE